MKEYKVEMCKVKEAEKLMNTLAKEGWHVVSTVLNISAGYGIVITFEKEI